MTERPILFSGPMVRALLAGSKTQTRRIVNPQFRPDAQPEEMVAVDDDGHQVTGHSGRWWDAVISSHEQSIHCRYGEPADRLWVRETWQLHERFTDVGRVVYAATAGRSWTEAHRDIPIDKVGDCRAKPFQQGFRPSIHMPRWASRLTLDITEVRVERLQDISEADAEAEGVREPSLGRMVETALGDVPRDRCGAVAAYAALWESINGKGSWAVNPWVWVVTFEVRR